MRVNIFNRRITVPAFMATAFMALAIFCFGSAAQGPGFLPTPPGCPQRYDALPENVGAWEGYVHQKLNESVQRMADHRNEQARGRYVLTLSNWKLNADAYGRLGTLAQNPRPKPELAWGVTESEDNRCLVTLVQLPSPVMPDIEDTPAPVIRSGVIKVGGPIPNTPGWFYALPGDTAAENAVGLGSDGKSYRKQVRLTPWGAYPYYISAVP